VGKRTQTSATHGDDLYAFVGYAADGDPVHHCSCIANWGRDGAARGLSAVGAGFIAFQRNDIARTQWAGVYLAQEDSYVTFGAFDLWVQNNTSGADPADARTNEPRNPAGSGVTKRPAELQGKQAPSFEDPASLIKSSTDRPVPRGFGPVASHWQPRCQLAGGRF
jgi:hypothetical protein